MKKHALAVLFGILGVVAALSAWHLYVDHQNLHALVNMVQAQAAQAAAKQPTAEPAK